MSESDTSVVDKGKAAIIHNDTLTNLVANLATTRDKNSYNEFVEGTDISLDRETCDTIYRFHWMAKVVDIPAYDMTRQWRLWHSDSKKPTDIKLITAEEKRLDYKAKIQEALTWGNLYGGCAVVISVDGHGDSSTELNIKDIRKGQLKSLYVIDRHRIFPQCQTLITDPYGGYYGDPELYMLANSTQLVHRSRIVKFIGKKVPFWPKQRLLWWGDSVLNRLYETFKNTESVIGSIASMVHETNIDVISVEGLADKLASEGDENVQKRFMLMALMKSINNMMLLDNTESYERKSMEFKALPELMQKFLELLSAATDIPATRFLGKSPDGMNATGEGDLNNYYDMISGKQESDLEPQLRYLDEAMIRSLFGDYPKDLDWEFNPLWQMSDTNQANLNKVKTESLLNLQMLGVPDEAILKDIQEMELSNNLTEELINTAIAEIPEDDDTEEYLEGDGDDK